MKGWYEGLKYYYPPPSQITVNMITTERVAFYQILPLPGETTLVLVDLFVTDHPVLE